MDDCRLADGPVADDARKPLRPANSHRAELAVVTEVDLVTHHYPISRVRWRERLAPVGD